MITCHKSLTKNFSMKYVILLCLYMGHIVKSHTTTNISQHSPTKTYFCDDSWKLIQCLCLMECMDNRVSTEMMVWNVLNLIDIVRLFYEFRRVECYQNPGLLSSTHVLITQSHSCIYGVLTTLYGCYMVF